MKLISSKGYSLIVILIFVAALGLLIFSAISNSFSFKNRLFGKLYDKPKSQASDNEPPVWVEEWKDDASILQNWQVIGEKCFHVNTPGFLDMACQNGELVTKTDWDKNSNIFVIGTVSGGSLGLTQNSKTTALLAQQDSIVSSNGFIVSSDPNTTHIFKIVLAKVGQEYFYYYYLDSANEPVQKTKVNLVDNLHLSISCKTLVSSTAKCKFGKITVSGSTIAPL